MADPRPPREAAPHPDRALIGGVAGGVLALAVGIVVMLIAPSTATFGWFAYAPLGDVVISPGGVLLTWQSGSGLALAVLGLLALAFCGGLVVGSRRRR
jgi:hypothetical protein